MFNRSDPTTVKYATYMADPITDKEPYKDGILLVSRRLDSCAVTHPNGELDFRLAKQEFRAEAGRVVDFMQSCMPQGLVDAIFAELADRQASIFHVAAVQEEKKGETI